MLSLTILLADDDLSYRSRLVHQLENLGHRLLPVQNGIEALEVLNQQKVDLLITDFQMPRMDGARLASKVRKLYSFPIFLCSGAPRLIPTLETNGVEIFAKSQHQEIFQRVAALSFS